MTIRESGPWIRGIETNVLYWLWTNWLLSLNDCQLWYHWDSLWSTIPDASLQVHTGNATLTLHMPIMPSHAFPCSFPIDGEVANLLRTYWRHGELSWHVKIVCRVANKSATSHCNGIWETTRHDRHKGLLLAPTCWGFATGKLRGNWCNGFWENLLWVSC